jgi:hypothetical protein
MPSEDSPYGIIQTGPVRRIEHVFDPSGWLGLDIELVFPGETSPAVVRVTMSKDQLLSLLAQLEATRQQFGFPLPAVFGEQKPHQ